MKFQKRIIIATYFIFIFLGCSKKNYSQFNKYAEPYKSITQLYNSEEVKKIIAGIPPAIPHPVATAHPKAVAALHQRKTNKKQIVSGNHDLINTTPFKQKNDFTKVKQTEQTHWDGLNVPKSVLLIMAVFFPFFAVGIAYGYRSKKFRKAVLLTLLFYTPGMIYAIIKILQFKKKNETTHPENGMDVKEMGSDSN